MEMTPEQLRQEIDRLVQAGDEAALEKFVREHIAELPEEAQEKFLLATYQEALEEKLAANDIATLQEQGIAALEQIEAIRAEAQKE